MSTKARKQKEADASPTNGADAPSLSESLSSGEPGNLDKIRTILFGAQSREYEKRFAALEEMVQRELSAQKDTMRHRFEELESFIKAETDALNTRLAAEQKQRKQGLAQAAEDRQALARTMQENLADLENRLAESERTQRERLLSRSKDLSEEMQQQFETLATRIREAVELLRTEKTDRLSLADLFEEMSSRLRDDFRLTLDE